MVIPRSGNPAAARLGGLALRQPDMRFSSTAAAALRNDGMVSTQVINSVMVASPNARAQSQFRSGTKSSCCGRSQRAGDSAKNSGRHRLVFEQQFDGVCSQAISVPVLFMAMGGRYYVGDGRRWEGRAQRDKDFAVIQARPAFTPCTRCEGAGPIREQREEPVRLYREVDQRPLLNTLQRSRAGIGCFAARRSNGHRSRGLHKPRSWSPATKGALYRPMPARSRMSASW